MGWYYRYGSLEYDSSPRRSTGGLGSEPSCKNSLCASHGETCPIGWRQKPAREGCPSKCMSNGCLADDCQALNKTRTGNRLAKPSTASANGAKRTRSVV